MTDNEKKCECGCSHDKVYEERYDTITLTLDDDKEVVYIILGIFECDDKEYIALLPEDKEEGEDVFIFGYTETGEDEVELEEIDDEDEFNRVSEKFDELFMEEDDFDE